MRKRKELNPHVIIITLISVLVIMQAVTLFFTVNPPVTPVIQGMTAEQKAAVADNSILLDKVRKVTQIDESVEPVIAIVTDVEMSCNWYWK
jgi:hypothetical protein